MDRLLIVGMEGIVGANLGATLCDRFDVLGLAGGAAPEIQGVSAIDMDLNDPAQLAAHVRQFGPQWIVFCGELSRSSWDGPYETGERDAAAAAALAREAQAVRARLTVVSTDAVFAGSRIFHDERAPATGPAAAAALAMERALDPAATLIVRTNAYGWSCGGEKIGFAERLWETFENGSDESGWQSPAGATFVPALPSSAAATPILASDLAFHLARAYELGLAGLYHIGGAERTSFRRFAAELASLAGHCHSAETIAPASRPVWETSLISARAQGALGMPLPMLREGLARFVDQAASGYRTRLQGGRRTAHATAA
ncbi:MAG: sugar nucleotide-binding protein [Planctomycetia bacterium]|nr:sugar nucleotide-binding protein [Planctomycetia bacterium]